MCLPDTVAGAPNLPVLLSPLQSPLEHPVLQRQPLSYFTEELWILSFKLTEGKLRGCSYMWAWWDCLFRRAEGGVGGCWGGTWSPRCGLESDNCWKIQGHHCNSRSDSQTQSWWSRPKWSNEWKMRKMPSCMWEIFVLRDMDSNLFSYGSVSTVPRETLDTS